MSAQIISILEHETSAEVLRFPVPDYVERQLPSPEALVASFIEAGYEGNQAVFEERRAKALLSGMVDGDPNKAFDEITQMQQKANRLRLQSDGVLGLGSIALVETGL